MRARLVRSSPRVPPRRRRGRPAGPVRARGLRFVRLVHQRATRPERLLRHRPGAATPGAAAPSAIPTAELYKTVLKRYRASRTPTRRPTRPTTPAPSPTSPWTPPDPGHQRRGGDQGQGRDLALHEHVQPRVYARSKDSTKVYVIDCVNTLVAYRYSAKPARGSSSSPVKPSSTGPPWRTTPAPGRSPPMSGTGNADGPQEGQPMSAHTPPPDAGRPPSWSRP